MSDADPDHMKMTTTGPQSFALPTVLQTTYPPRQLTRSTSFVSVRRATSGVCDVGGRRKRSVRFCGDCRARDDTPLLPQCSGFSSGVLWCVLFSCSTRRYAGTAGANNPKTWKGAASSADHGGSVDRHFRGNANRPEKVRTCPHELFNLSLIHI